MKNDKVNYNKINSASAAIYARVSTTKQAEENTSIDIQLSEARKLIKERGWSLHEEFVDPGASGRSDKNRPQFNRMISQALSDNPPFEIIIVYDHSRFYRNIGESEVTRSRLTLNGVKVVSIKQPIEDDGLSGSLAISVQALMDDHHSRITALKVRDGMAASAREGFFVGGLVPFGYVLDPVEKRGTKIKHKLKIEPNEAYVVRMIYELCLQGHGQKSIVKKLNDEFLTPKNGKQWYQSGIARILTSATYAGRHIFRPTNWRTKKTVHRSEWIDIPCPAIIDEATFQNVQQLLAERDRRVTPPRYTTSNVLLGKIAQCGSCGGNMQLTTGTSHTGKIYSYYRCAAFVLKGKCPGGQPISISRDTLDDLVIGRVSDELLTPLRIREIVEKAVQRRSINQGEASGRLSQLRHQYQATKRRETNLWDLAAELGIKGRHGFLEKLDALQEDVANLERQIAAQEALLSHSIRPLSDNEANAKCSEMRAVLFNADPRLKRQFVRAVISKVVVLEDEVRIFGSESTLAETASGVNIHSRPAVRGFEREWCARQDSNLWPPD